MKKLISIMLIALVTVSLVACGSKTENNPLDESSNTEGDNSKEVNGEEVTDESVAADATLGEQEIVSTEHGEHVLVVYFSATGNTKDIAEKIAAATDADLYEIKAAEEYTDADINYNDSSSRTSKEQNDSSARPEIGSETISLDGYDTMYIGYPIWWGEEPRIMDTFVESYNFDGITMIPFCTSASSNIGNSGNNLAENAGSGNWIAGQRFDAEASESEIEDWIGSLQ